MVSHKEKNTGGNLGKMIKVKNLKRIYNKETVPVKALNGVTFEVKPGEFIAVMGPSGSGKSTLLHILGLLDNQTSGEYTINELNASILPETEKTYYRLTQLGYVFQEYALIDEMTALGNVILALMMEGMSKKEAEKYAKKALDRVGLEGKYDRLQSQLSGGERQRVAVARAIASDPHVLFADEPCANLDTRTSAIVLDVFKKLNKEFGLTIIMVTHEDWHTKYVSRIINLKDGKIEKDIRKRKTK